VDLNVTIYQKIIIAVIGNLVKKIIMDNTRSKFKYVQNGVESLSPLSSEECSES